MPRLHCSPRRALLLACVLPLLVVAGALASPARDGDGQTAPPPGAVKAAPQLATGVHLPCDPDALSLPDDGDVGFNAWLSTSWWKLKVSAKGFSVDPETGATTPASFKSTAYMYMEVLPPTLTAGGPDDGGDGGDGGEGGFPLYNYVMWTEVTPEQWAGSYGETVWVNGADEDGAETLMVHTFMVFVVGDAVVAGTHTGRLTVDVKDFVFKSAKLKSLAGELQQATLDSTGKINPAFHGALKVKGETVSVSELPFAP